MIKTKSFRYLLSAILVITAMLLYFRNQREPAVSDTDSTVQVKTYQTAAGWGYDILRNGKVYIHQEFIPAIPGSHGFGSEADALKVAREVASRISSNKMPSITVDELKAWGILSDSLARK